MTEKPALLIIDMVEDYFKDENHYPITPLARKIIPVINLLIKEFRKKNFPVIFSTDAFAEDDFLFTGKMHPHAIKGSKGAQVVADLDMAPEDLWLPKPRFSAFFDIGLEKILRDQQITLCAVAGIATNFCVLATAMDAICHNFKAVIVDDCSTAFSETMHAQCLDLYRKNPLYPLFRVMNSEDFVSEI
ncbi:cysteine hydrolase family protein [Desulfobacula phenolica]|uniref:Nicotinamidase-related amidase n=1 Tax=Desulfobacula phenolica TaxID=90732 RepID=A0A1H2IGE8_9BACT|nr:isochorismatase family cysteine hydrolase [Desulfobacula phenolica]SDU43229.1 Nicotinamidase-related amidase [Desulfobacula phenolica]